MKATRFLSKPFIVTGFRVTERNMNIIAKWCEGSVVITDDGRAFIRVPVSNARTKKQTEAHVGTWVLKSKYGREDTFKVYTQDWVDRQFDVIPEDEIGDDDEIEGDEAVEEHGQNTVEIPGRKGTRVTGNVRAFLPKDDVSRRAI